MRSILVVGANSEIGYATSKVFAKNGYNVHLASRNISNLQNKKNQIEINYNVKCQISHLDIENDKNINSFLINNPKAPSIILLAAGLLETATTTKEKILNVNYLSQVNFIEKLITKYHSQNILNTIIGISSVAGDRGRKDIDVYSASKSSYSLYLEKLRHRYIEKKIHVLIIKPGWVNTKMIKDKKIPRVLTASTDFVGKKIFEAYKNKKNTIYVPNIWFIIMFIYRLIPNFIFTIIKK